MAQGQRGNGTVAPDTLPADFFEQQGAPAPDTLPGGFFDKQSPAATTAPPAQAAQQPPPAKLTAAPMDTSGMTLGDVYQLQQRMGRPLTVSGGSFGTQQARPMPIDPVTLMSIPTLTSPIAEAAAAERFWPAMGRLATRFGINAVGTYGGTYGANRLADYLPESWRPWVEEAGGLIGGMGAALGGGKLFPEPAVPTLTPKETAAIGDVTKAPMEPPRLGPITEEAAAEQQREAEAAARAKSYRPGKPLGTIEPTEVGQRPSPSRESIFPGGTFRGSPASAQYPTTVPLQPLIPPKGGVGASIQTPPPPVVETPVAPPRASPSRERMFPGGYKGRPASAGYPTTDVSVTQTPRAGGGAGTTYAGRIAATTEEGIPGSLAKPTGRLVLTPEQAQAQERMLKLATQRASERGMQFAGGMVPGEGRKVPWTPTPTVDRPYPDPREIIRFTQEEGALGSIRGRQPGAIEPQPEPAVDPTVEAVQKTLQREPVTDEERLRASIPFAQTPEGQQAMREYTRSELGMGRAKRK